MVVWLYILSLLWVVSIFTFARLRISLSAKKNITAGIHKDWIFQLYLKISGIIILCFIFSLLNIH
jgi:hypothetical protein